MAIFSIAVCARTFLDMLSLLNAEGCEVEECVESLWPVNNASNERTSVSQANLLFIRHHS